MRPFTVYPHSLLLQPPSNSSHVNGENERNTESFPFCSPIRFLTLKPCGRSPLQVQDCFSCNLPMVFLSKVLPPKLFPFDINYPLSRLAHSTQKGTEALGDFFSVFSFFSPLFSLSTTCASLCIYRVAPHHLEDITACTVGTKANRYKRGLIVCLCAVMLPI